MLGFATVKVNNHNYKLKIDTDLTVLPESESRVRVQKDRPELEPAKIHLYGAAMSLLLI